MLEIARRYDAAFEGMEASCSRSSATVSAVRNHLYVTRMDFAASVSRADNDARAARRGIGSQVHYIPVPYQPYYRPKGLAQGSWPHAEHYYREALTIPLYSA